MKIILEFDADGLDKEYPEGIVWPKSCGASSPDELLAFVRESLLDNCDHVVRDYLKVEFVGDPVEEDTSKPDWNRLRQLVIERTMLRPDNVVALIKEWLGS